MCIKKYIFYKIAKTCKSIFMFIKKYTFLSKSPKYVTTFVFICMKTSKYVEYLKTFFCRVT